ncbi:MAG: serine hydrolase [Bacteroidota bacterium]
MYHRLLSILLVLVAIACQAPKQKESSPFDELTKLIDQYARNSLAKGDINSLSIAVYKDGLVYQSYYGELDQGMGNTPNDETLYEIGSLSKVFAGSLAARAVVDQKISLDDDIRLYLGDEYAHLELDGTPVRIHDLVTHTLGFDTPKGLAGIYDSLFAGAYQDMVIDYGMDDLLEELKSIELSHKPGTNYAYSNAGPELVAYILEQVYGMPYSKLLTQFFDELGLENTRLYDSRIHENRLSLGYTEGGQVATLVKNPLLGGAGGVISTLPDLTKFMKYQLESTDPLVKESTRFLLQDEEDGLGYFWDLGIGDAEGFYYKKSGTTNGAETVVLVCPDSDYGVVMIMNNQSEAAVSDYEELFFRIENDLIEYPRINLWSLVEDEFMTDPEKAATRYRKLSEDKEAYHASSNYLNMVGYGLIYEGKVSKAIEVFLLAVSVDPDNANLYDSLGEAYFLMEEYENSRENFERSLALDPTNSNAEEYLLEIEKLLN